MPNSILEMVRGIGYLPPRIRNLKIKYVKNVLIKSNSGYLIMNSGHTNLTGRSSGKMSVEEILSHIPTATVLKENSKTSKDNNVVIWGSSK